MSTGKIVLLIALGVLFISVAVLGIVLHQVPFDFDIDSIAPLESDLCLLSAEDPLNKSGSPALAKVKDGKISEEEVKILFLTDVHLCEVQDQTRESLDRMVSYIEREKPDLIILGGDTLNGLNDKVRVYQFRNIMDAFNVYWAPVLGNHEGDRPLLMTDRDIIVDLWSASPRCLMESDTKYTSDRRVVDGYGNYVVSILGSDGYIKNAFFMLDNGDKLKLSEYSKWGIDKKEKKVDVAISAAQVDWYKETYSAMKEKNGGTLTHMCVIHKPLQEMGAAIKIRGKVNYKYEVDWSLNDEAVEAGWMHVDGTLRDKVHCPPYTDGELYKELVANGAKAVFFGHDHVSDLTLYNAKDDIYLTYIRLTSAKEHVGDAEGYNVMKIAPSGDYVYNAYNKDGSFDVQLFKKD